MGAYNGSMRSWEFVIAFQSLLGVCMGAYNGTMRSWEFVIALEVSGGSNGFFIGVGEFCTVG